MNPRPLILIDTGIIGGPGRGIVQLATFLAKTDVDYLICTFSYRTPKSQEFAQELTRLNLNAATIAQGSVWDPTPLWQFLRLGRQGRYNVIQSHGYKSHLVALIVSRILGVPWIAFAHGWTRENRKVALYHSLDTWMLRFAESVIAVSPPLWAHFAELRGRDRQTILLLNAVERGGLLGRDGGAAIRRRYVKNESQFLVGCFGRLSSEKGQDVLLRAVAIVVERNHDVVVLLLGDGPELQALQKLSSKLGISERVFFHPHTSAIRDYYEAIDMLIVPSRSEGLPNVVLEAMCFDVPVIATDVGAVSEVITDGETGWIVPPEDEEALARVVVAVLSDRETRSGVSKAGSRMVGERFSPTTRSQRILDVYHQLLA